jgi:hypothetical protein
VEFDLKASFALRTFATIFQPEVYAILPCFDYCLRECMTDKNDLHLLGQSGRIIGVKFAHSVIKAGALVLELSFYS